MNSILDSFSISLNLHVVSADIFLGVNPFNQPGVESYKKNMFALLGKPGFEKERKNY